MKHHSVTLLIVFHTTAVLTASRWGHHHLSASGDAEIDAMDAVAMRRLSSQAQQRATADSSHLRAVAAKFFKAAATLELQVQEELQDAQAIDTTVRLESNHSDLTQDEVEDAQQLRKVAVIEEEQVISDQHAAERLSADAAAIASAGSKRREAEIVDAETLEGFVTNEGVYGNHTDASFHQSQEGLAAEVKKATNKTVPPKIPEKLRTINRIDNQTKVLGKPAKNGMQQQKK